MRPRKKQTKKNKKARRRLPQASKHRERTPGEWFEKLVAVQARLRAPNGCPWDREQTHQSLRTYLIEEAYEVVEALESGSDAKFAEEMGDLLLQIVFHSQIAREEGRFSNDKNHSKSEENVPKETSLLDGVSRALPGTLEGFQLTRKASRIGFDWEDANGVFEKMREEIEELKKALKETDPLKTEEELGDLLFAAVNLSRFLKIDPEIALKKANAKFSRRFREMERLARKNGREFKDLPREEMEALWNASKKAEGKQRLPEMSGTQT